MLLVVSLLLSRQFSEIPQKSVWKMESLAGSRPAKLLKFNNKGCARALKKGLRSCAQFESFRSAMHDANHFQNSPRVAQILIFIYFSDVYLFGQFHPMRQKNRHATDHVNGQSCGLWPINL